MNRRYSDWKRERQTLFPVADEFHLADAIYPFAKAFEAGMSPKVAYEDFDMWAACTESA